MKTLFTVLTIFSSLLCCSHGEQLAGDKKKALDARTSKIVKSYKEIIIPKIDLRELSVSDALVVAVRLAEINRPNKTKIEFEPGVMVEMWGFGIQYRLEISKDKLKQLEKKPCKFHAKDPIKFETLLNSICKEFGITWSVKGRFFIFSD